MYGRIAGALVLAFVGLALLIPIWDLTQDLDTIGEPDGHCLLDTGERFDRLRVNDSDAQLARTPIPNATASVSGVKISITAYDACMVVATPSQGTPFAPTVDGRAVVVSTAQVTEQGTPYAANPPLPVPTQAVSLVDDGTWQARPNMLSQGAVVPRVTRRAVALYGVLAAVSLLGGLIVYYQRE